MKQVRISILQITTIVLTLFATYVLLLSCGTSFHYHTVFPDDFLKNPHKRCRKNPYRLKKFCTFFDVGIKLKDFASTIEIRHTFLHLTISNYFINIAAWGPQNKLRSTKFSPHLSLSLLDKKDAPPAPYLH